MRRTITAVLCAVSLFGVLSSAAFGNSSVGRPGGNDLGDPENDLLVYEGDETASDRLTVSVEAGKLVFKDPAHVIDPGQGCNDTDAHTVVCSQSNLELLRVSALEGADNRVIIEDDVAVRSRITSGAGNDTLWGGDGTELISGGGGGDVIGGGHNPTGPAQDLLGGAGDDLIVGGVGGDSINGGSGDDELVPSLGVDEILGGADVDSVSYSGRSAGVSVSLDSLANDGEPNEHDNVGEDVETIVGTAHPDHLIGSAKANDLHGYEGNDTLEGLDGADELRGGDGQDELLGGNDVDLIEGGDDVDTLRGGNDVDLLLAGPGADTVAGGSGNDYLDGGVGPDTLTGGPGDIDQAYYSNRTQPVTAALGGANEGEAGEGDTIAADVESLAGGSGDDVLTGNDGANFLRGGAGADTLDGRGGEDFLRGDGGNDTFLSSGDGAVDTDSCGDDDDSVKADPQDTLVDCEAVELLQAPGGGATGAGGDPVVPDGVPGGGVAGGGIVAGPKVLIAKRVVKVGRRRVARIKLTCPATASVRCTGLLTLSRSKAKLGSTTFSIAAGRSARVKVRLELARSRRKGLRVRAVAVAAAVGTESATTTRMLRLRRTR